MTVGRWGYFLAWAVAGAGAALAIITPMSIGPVAFLTTGLWVGLLITRREARGPTAFGAIAGPAVIACWLAWSNRDGPGDVCTSTARSTTCTEEWNPWPFAVSAVVLAVAAVVPFVLMSRRSRVRS